MAQIAIHHNPFHLHRNVDLFQPRIGQTVRGWLDERGIAEFSKPTLCLVIKLLMDIKRHGQCG